MFYYCSLFWPFFSKMCPLGQAGIQKVVERGLDLASAKTLYGCKQIDTLSEFLKLPANVDTLFEVFEAV